MLNLKKDGELIASVAMHHTLGARERAFAALVVAERVLAVGIGLATWPVTYYSDMDSVMVWGLTPQPVKVDREACMATKLLGELGVLKEVVSDGDKA